MALQADAISESVNPLKEVRQGGAEPLPGRHLLVYKVGLCDVKHLVPGIRDIDQRRETE